MTGITRGVGVIEFFVRYINEVVIDVSFTDLSDLVNFGESFRFELVHNKTG